MFDEPKAVVLDPVSSFLYSYANYILFAIGLFIVLYSVRRLLQKKDELKIINRGVETNDDGTTED